MISTCLKRTCIKKKRTIFVISPINKKDEEGFDFTELFFKEIVEPAAEAAGGFDAPIRADRVSKPGSITAQVVNNIVSSDVCVADLTGRNPNVMYEVAIAHAADKPVILLQQESGGPPFDFTDQRTINYKTRADLANRARRELTEHLKNAHHEKSDKNLEGTLHPVRMIFKNLKAREEATDAESVILDRLDKLTATVQALSRDIPNARINRTIDQDMVRKKILHSMINDNSFHLLPEEMVDLMNRVISNFGDEIGDHLFSHLKGASPDWEKMRDIYLRLQELQILRDENPTLSRRELKKLGI